jgi:outer membrane protein assembly factor BamB
MICLGVLCLALGLWVLPASHGADWPRLGGPEAAGVSSETGLARVWPTNGPAVLWSTEVGEGFAGPAVSRGQVFLLDRVPSQKDVLRCFDLGTGEELWSVSYEAPGSLPYNGSRNVPTVDNNYIFIIGPFGHFHCIDRRSHQILWARHLVDDFRDPEVDRDEPSRTREEKLARTQLPIWGMTQAPLLYRDTVVVAPQTQKIGLVAYEKASGKIRWRSDYVGRNWYSHVSPCLTALCGVEQIIMLAQPSDPEKAPDEAPPANITSLDPATGKILWRAQTPGPHKIPMPQPLRVADDRLLITGGYQMGCLILQVMHGNEGWKTRVLAHDKRIAAHIHSPVLYEDRIYVTSFKEQGGAHSGLVCLDSTGEPRWQTGPSLQFDSGGLLIADHLAYLLHGKTGELCLLDLSTPGPTLLAKAKVLSAKGGNVWAPLALSDGKLLVRDQHQMKCLQVDSSKLDEGVQGATR